MSEQLRRRRRRRATRARPVTEPLGQRRLMSAGDMDTAFGSEGFALGDVGRESVAAAAAVHTDGRILVAGRQSSNGLLARFNADGTLDTRPSAPAVRPG